MSSSAATSTYAESVASCRAPAPATPRPPHAAVRRHLDFAAGDGGELDDDEVEDEDEDDFLFRAAEETERSHYEAQRRASAPPPPPSQPPAFLERPCICGRGGCDVEERELGRWAYVCPATPVSLSPPHPTSFLYPPPPPKFSFRVRKRRENDDLFLCAWVGLLEMKCTLI